MPEIGRPLVASADLPQLWPCRLLRSVTKSARNKTFSRDQAPDHRGAYDPPEGWGWCYVDEVMFDLSGRPTPHLGPIPRFY
jgi:hypothetical protein